MQQQSKAVRKSNSTFTTTTDSNLHKLLQPELIPSSPSSMSSSSCTIAPSLAPTMSPPQPSKNLWFSPQVFLQSFPVFPPPTRNQTPTVQPIPTVTPTIPATSITTTATSNKLPHTLDISVFPKQEKPEKQELKLEASGIQKKRKTKRNKIDIPLNDLIRYMTLPQSVAAKKLNVSLSTLKRRYYELVMELEGTNVNSNKIKWPSMPTNYHEMACVTEEVVPAEQKASLKYILNRYDAHDNTFVDTLSMTVLNFSFKQNSEKLQ